MAPLKNYGIGHRVITMRRSREQCGKKKEVYLIEKTQ